VEEVVSSEVAPQADVDPNLREAREVGGVEAVCLHAVDLGGPVAPEEAVVEENTHLWG
jgi:hypothetical protein